MYEELYKTSNIITQCCNEIRKNIARLLKEKKGQKIYITKHNKLIADITVYTRKQRKKAELDIAKVLVENKKG